MPDGLFTAAPEPEADSLASADTQKDPREVSTIAFPYLTLADAIGVANVIQAKGALPIARDQLAAAMRQQVGSGAFANKVGAARMFGLIETVAGKYQLTRLGFDIVSSDELRVSGAKVRAFLNVPLYRRTYEAFRNSQLPPRPLGLESAFVEFGVAPKQKERARRAFDNSARLAGFFEHGDDRLVEPVLGAAIAKNMESADQQARPAVPVTTASPATTLLPTDHPFINGLLLSLPPALGDNWSAADRVKWLKAAATAFELMFEGGGSITIEAADPEKTR